MRQITYIRIKQFYRMLLSIGIWLLVLIAPIVFIAILGLLEKVQQGEGVNVAVIAIVLLLSSHIVRRDGIFLQKLNILPFFVYVVDYTLVFIPITLMILIFTGNWQVPLIIHLAIPIISLLPQIKFAKSRLKKGVDLSCIPIPSFEWRTGIRQYFWPLLIGYVLGLLLCQFIPTALLTTIIFAYIAVNFYDYIEAKEMVETIAYKKRFLLFKAKQSSIVFHALLLPHYLLFLVLHMEYWYLLLTVIIMVEMLLLFGLFLKYASYYPGRGKLHHQMIIGLFTLGALVPIFMPVSIIFLIVFYKRAVKNLKYFYA